MYNNEPPLRLKAADLEAISKCPASAGPGSRLTMAPLDRWKAVMYALEAALSNGGDVDRAVAQNTSWLDPVQRDLVADLVANGVLILGASDADVEFNPEDNVVSVDYQPLNIELASYFQVVVTDPHDAAKVERFKVRTGRQGTPPFESAILLAGGDPGDRFADLMLRDGTIEPIEMSETEIASSLERLYELAARERNLRDRRPGWQCYRCDRIARCGQYPTDGYKVAGRQRTIRVSKSDMLRLDGCHRRLAWKVVYTIPADTEDEAGPGAVTGLLFHEVISDVLVAEDPDAEFARHLDQMSPDERDSMAGLYERHNQIEASHVSVVYSLTEYQVGATFILEGLDSDRDGNVKQGAAVAVTVIARTDAVGRELDNTPAIIEHRTGKTSDRIDERETAMYALSTARLLGVDSVAVHQHSLGAPGDPECIRVVYDADGLAEAEELLSCVLAPVVTWHPVDATGPTYSVGDWCTTCAFQERCARFRD